MKSIISRYAEWVVHNRLKVLAFTSLLVTAIALPANRVSFDTNYRIWFEEDDPYLASYDRFIGEFGNDDMFVVAFKDEAGVLREKPIATIQRLTEKFWRITGVIRVDSIANFQATRATDDGISVKELFPRKEPVTAATLQSAADYMAREPLVIGSLITADHKVAIMRGKFAPTAIRTGLPAKVYAELREVLDAETAHSGYRFHLAGGPITDQAFDQVAQDDMQRLLPVLLLILVAILVAIFFSYWGVVIPLGVAVFAIAAVMGLNGLFGYKLNAITASSPQLLLGISVATTMHLFSTFLEARASGLDSKAAVRSSVEVNLVPIVLTNFTTSLGFFSFLFGSIVPISRLGFTAGFGTLLIMVLSITLVPALLSFYPERATRSLPTRLDLAGWFRRVGRFATRRSRGIIVGWLTLTMVFACFTPLLVADSNPVGYFKPGYWFRDAIDFLEREGSGGAVYEIIVRGRGPDAIRTGEYMRDLERLTDYLSREAPGDFTNVYSLSTIVRNVNRSLHGDDQAFHVIPDEDNSVAQYLLFYTLSVPVGMDINDRMNADNSATRVTVIRPLVSTRVSRRNIDTISAWANQNLRHVTIEFTGRDVLYTNMGNNITDSLIRSLGFAVLTIVPALFLMFRSVKAGVISVIANVSPLVIILGLMGLGGIMLDVGTVMVASLGLGIAVDDTVHLLAHYYDKRRAGEGTEAAVHSTLGEIGTAVSSTTLALMASFLVFLGADFMPNFYFGVLISLVVLLALLADLTLTPALLHWFYSKPHRVATDPGRATLPPPAHRSVA